MAETNDRKAAKAGLGYTVGNILLRGISVISAPLFARLFTVQDNGAYSTYQAYVNIIYIILLYNPLKIGEVLNVSAHRAFNHFGGISSYFI